MDRGAHGALAREKAFTRQRDALSAQRRELPWERVEKRYVFQTASGSKTLAELFGDKSQLVVYHFMFGPDWELGCKRTRWPPARPHTTSRRPKARSEREGLSVFLKDASGAVLHTYSCYARGIDLMNTAYNVLDVTPKGRNEGDGPMNWLKRRFEYER